MMLARRSGLAVLTLTIAVLLAFLAGTNTPTPARAVDMSSVSGTVTVSGGSSLAEVEIILKVISYPTGSRTKASVSTHATAPAPDGRYVFTVSRPAGAFYLLEFRGGGGNAVVPVSYRGALKATVVQDAALEPGGVLTGTVKVPAGVDAAGITVHTGNAAGTGTGAGITQQSAGQSATVNPDGSFRITGLGSGSYTLEFTGTTVPRSYAPGTGNPAEAAAVYVAAGGQATAPETTLVNGVFIEGHVNLPAGWSMGEVRISAHGPDGEATGDETRPGGTGNYRLGPLWPGAYKVSFQGLGTDAGGVNKPLGRLWFPGTPSLAAAGQLTLAAGQLQGGVDAVLVHDGGMSLTVDAPGGTGGKRIPVAFTDPDGKPVTTRWVNDGAPANVAAMAASSYAVLVNSGPDAVPGFGTQQVNNGAPIEVQPGGNTALGTIQLTPGTPNTENPVTPSPSTTPTPTPSASPAATASVTATPTASPVGSAASPPGTPGTATASETTAPAAAPAGGLPSTGTTLMGAAAGLTALLAGAAVVLVVRVQGSRRRQRH